MKAIFEHPYMSKFDHRDYNNAVQLEKANLNMKKKVKAFIGFKKNEQSKKPMVKSNTPPNVIVTSSKQLNNKAVKIESINKKCSRNQSRDNKPSEQTANSSNGVSGSSADNRGQSFKKKLRLASFGRFLRKSINKHNSPSKHESHINNSNHKATAEYGVCQFEKVRTSKMSNRSGFSGKIKWSEQKTPKHSKKKLLNVLKKQSKINKTQEFAEYAFNPQKQISSPNENIKGVSFYNFKSPKSNLNQSKSTKNKNKNVLFFRKKGNKKDKLFNLGKLLQTSDHSGSLVCNGNIIKVKKKQIRQSNQKQDSLSGSNQFLGNNLTNYYQMGVKKPVHKRKRRASEIQFIFTEKDSFISKKSNNSLQIFPGKQNKPKNKFKYEKGDKNMGFLANQKQSYNPSIYLVDCSQISQPKDKLTKLRNYHKSKRKKSCDQSKSLRSGKFHKRHMSNILDKNTSFVKQLTYKNKVMIPISKSRAEPRSNSNSFLNLENGYMINSKKRNPISELRAGSKRVSKITIIKEDKGSLQRSMKSQTNNLKNLLIQKKLKRGMSFGHILNNSLKVDKYPNRGRAQLTFLKTGQIISNPSYEVLNNSSSRQIKENPYYSYFEKE